MKTLSYAPEKTRGQYLRKMLLPILGIGAAAFLLLFASMVPVVISEELYWLTVTGIVSTLVLSVTAAVCFGLWMEKENHIYWITEDMRVFRLDAGVKFWENPEDHRGGTLYRQVKVLRAWAEGMDRLPWRAPEIVQVIRMERKDGGWQVIFLEKWKKRLKKRRIFISPYWIQGDRLAEALQRLAR